VGRAGRGKGQEGGGEVEGRGRGGRLMSYVQTLKGEEVHSNVQYSVHYQLESGINNYFPHFAAAQELHLKLIFYYM
jgi:hypothetical protein